MGEFVAITTQEQFDERIRDRLKQKDESLAKKYEGFLSPQDVEKMKTTYDKQISDLTKSIEDYKKDKADFEKTLAEKDAAIKAHESHSVKTRIANELGLPYEAIDYLKGDEEEAIKESAEHLKALFKTTGVPPLGNPEPPIGDPKDQAWNTMVKSLKKGE